MLQYLPQKLSACDCPSGYCHGSCFAFDPYILLWLVCFPSAFQPSSVETWIIVNVAIPMACSNVKTCYCAHLHPRVCQLLEDCVSTSVLCKTINGGSLLNHSLWDTYISHLTHPPSTSASYCSALPLPAPSLHYYMCGSLYEEEGYK